MILSRTIVPGRDINGPDARKYSERSTIFVAPTGKRGYLGATPELSTNTVRGIKEVIKNIKRGESREITVDFLPGAYKASTFFFDQNTFTYFKHDESGDSNYTVAFKSYDRNNKAIFDNTKTYTGFEPVGDLWRVRVDYEDTKKCSFVGYVNGVRTVPARWPKYGALSDYTTVTYDGTVYMKCLDSTSKFLSAVHDYRHTGGDISKIGAVYTYDFRGFGFTSITDILSNLPTTTYTEGIFYIPAISNNSVATRRGINIYSNTANYLVASDPSNIDPYKMCTEKGENTIIKDGDDYWFYYKPTSNDIIIGILDTVLTTHDAGNPTQWVKSGNPRTNTDTFKYALKTINGYTYYAGDSQENAYSVGFNFTAPENIKLYDLEFKHCLVPITLNNTISSMSLGTTNRTGDLEAFKQEFTSGVSITGCNLYNSFGSALLCRNVKDSLVQKNLIYGSECNGIRWTCGYNLTFDNNIIKNTQQVDTRHNGDFGAGVGNLFVHGDFFNGGHKSETLSAVHVSNNDLSYAGNNLKLDVGLALSAYNNRIYNGGFGCNSDMSCVYQGFCFTNNEDYRNKIYNNYISNARANTNNNFLGNLIYLDGTTKGPYLYNNIIRTGQTGIQHTSVDSPFVYNNIIYDTKIAGITNKSNGAALPINVNISRNVIVPNSDHTGVPSRAYLGWNGYSVNTRSISTTPYYCRMTYYNTTLNREETANLCPIAPWKGKIRYTLISAGGSSVIREPMLAFDGDNWICGAPTHTATGEQYVDGIYVCLSAANSSSYETPWDIPTENWVYLRGTLMYYTEFISFTQSTTRRANTTVPTITANNNVYWSLMTESSEPESDTSFFRYGIYNTSFNDINNSLVVPDPYILNDNSLPAVFGDMQPIEQQSILSDPLFIDTETFGISPESPLHMIDFEEIDTSNIGVYDTPDDPYWSLSAANLKPQPVINGNIHWSNYTVIPWPYDSLVEYTAPQVN